MFWCYLNIFRSIPALIIYFKMQDTISVDEDLNKNGQPSTAIGLHRALFYNAGGFRNIFYARSVRKFPILTKISKFFWRPMFGLGIDVKDEIGSGMQIHHGYSTIVFAKSIGKNFTVYQNVTVGRGKEINGNDIPIIGDNVTVYTGAVIIGGIHIGDRVKIGAGTTVVKDVPSDTTVVSSPARFVKHKSI